MWCAAGAPTALRRLDGMPLDRGLRACTPCVKARVMKVMTYIVWHWHIEGCGGCQLNG